MAANVRACQAFGPLVSEKKTKTLYVSAPHQSADTTDVRRAGQRNAYTWNFVRLGVSVDGEADLTPGLIRRKELARRKARNSDECSTMKEHWPRHRTSRAGCRKPKRSKFPSRALQGGCWSRPNTTNWALHTTDSFHGGRKTLPFTEAPKVRDAWAPKQKNGDGKTLLFAGRMVRLDSERRPERSIGGPLDGKEWSTRKGAGAGGNA